MVKTKEELEQLKQEYQSLSSKLSQLNDDELKFVTGGIDEKDEQMIGVSPEEHNIMI